MDVLDVVLVSGDTAVIAEFSDEIKVVSTYSIALTQFSSICEARSTLLERPNAILFFDITDGDASTPDDLSWLATDFHSFETIAILEKPLRERSISAIRSFADNWIFKSVLSTEAIHMALSTALSNRQFLEKYWVGGSDVRRKHPYLGQFSYDLDTQTLSLDQEMCELIGGGVGDTISLADFTARLHDDDRGEVQELFNAFSCERETVDFVVRLYQINDGCIWVRVGLFCNCSASESECRGFIKREFQPFNANFKEDTTQFLEQYRRSLGTVGTSGIGTVLYDIEGVIVDVNSEYAQSYGYTREEMIGMSARQLSSNMHSVEFWRNFWLTLKSGRVWSGEVINKSKTGSLVWEDLTVIPQYGQDSLIDWFLVLARDKTGEHNLREEVGGLKSRLEDAQKYEIVATMVNGLAHDFRNVLSGLSGYGQLMRMQCERDFDRDKITHYIGGLDQGLLQGKNMVENLLNFSKGEGGVGETVCVDDDLGQLVQIAHSLLKAGQYLEVKIEEEDLELVFNKSHLFQILLNLLVNASQASPQGSPIKIVVTRRELSGYCCCKGEHLTGEGIVFSVIDQGSGISAENMQKIFDPYFTTKGESGGTGLGLASTKLLLDKNGAFLQVESTAGEGTRFDICKPCDAITTGSTDGEERGPLHGLTIVLIDDNKIYAEILAETLYEAGAHVHAFTDVKKFISDLSSLPHFDLIVSDETMPDVCGVELLSYIRSQGYGVPVFLVTGASARVDRSNYASFGFDAFFDKPCDINKLIAAIVEFTAEH